MVIVKARRKSPMDKSEEYAELLRAYIAENPELGEYQKLTHIKEISWSHNIRPNDCPDIDIILGLCKIFLIPEDKISAFLVTKIRMTRGPIASGDINTSFCYSDTEKTIYMSDFAVAIKSIIPTRYNLGDLNTWLKLSELSSGVYVRKNLGQYYLL
jgi:hypothetical protein